MQEWYDLRDGHRHLLAHHAARPQDVPKLDYLPLSVVHWHAITVLHATRGNRSRSRSRLATEAQITTQGGHGAWPAGSRHAPGARERMICCPRLVRSWQAGCHASCHGWGAAAERESATGAPSEAADHTPRRRCCCRRRPHGHAACVSVAAPENPAQLQRHIAPRAQANVSD